MSVILTSVHGRRLGLDKDGYLTGPAGIRVPDVQIGASGSELSQSAVTAASTSANISAAGVTSLGSSAGANPTYNINAPKPGIRKSLVSIGASTGQIVSSTGAGATFTSTATGISLKATFVGLGQALDLIGLSTASWGVVGNVGAVAFSS